MEVVSVVAQFELARDAEVRRIKALYELLAALTKAGTLQEICELGIRSRLETTAADRAAYSVVR